MQDTVVHIEALLIHVVQILDIQTPDLRVLARAQVQARDLVDYEQQDARHHKGPGRGSGCAGELKSKLPEVAVPPASGIGAARYTVESGDEVIGKDARQKIADIAAYAVKGEDVETVVDREDMLVFDGVIAAGGSEEANERSDVYGYCRKIESVNRSRVETGGTVIGSRTITRRRGNSHQTCNDTRAESNQAELSLVEIVNQDPANTAAAPRQIGVDDNID